MRTLVAWLLVISLAGCAGSGPAIVKTGPETYAISRISDTAGAAAPENRALTRASAYCASLHKVMLPLDERISGCMFGCVGSEIRFMCLEATDPRLEANNPNSRRQ
jgi:hypothetical protein